MEKEQSRSIKFRGCCQCGKNCRNRFCSRNCYYRHKKENIYPGQFKHGHSGLVEANNPNWKGAKAGYQSIHNWLYLRLGKPKECGHCGSGEKKRYEWANISKKYKRDVTDWIRLCVSCHRKYDGHGFKGWMTRRSINARNSFQGVG